MPEPIPLIPPPPQRRALAASDLWWGLAALIVMALAWRLATVLLLFFAGILVALVLLRLMRPLQRLWRLSDALSLAIVVVTVLLLLVGGVWLMGASAAEQLQALRETLPRAMQALRQWLGTHEPGRWLLDVWSGTTFKPEGLQQLAGLASGTLNATAGAIGGTVLVAAIGIYLAADPGTYRRGMVRLVPVAHRPRAERALDAAARDLARWLLGQAVSMLAVGVLTALGLMLVGMPLVFTLGVIAGILEFVPYFGPVVSGVLIVAVALTEGEQTALAAAAVCVAVQQAEAYVVQPLVQRWAVRLPPVLGMLAVLLFGLLFGLPGVLLAVPLMVLTITLVNELYVKDLLEGRPAPAPPPGVPLPPARRKANL